MKRLTILTMLLVIGITVFVFGMLAGFAGPVAATAGVATTGLFAFSGCAAATLIPISIEYPA